jgi:Na+/melibiose symporter-like transporter
MYKLEFKTLWDSKCKGGLKMDNKMTKAEKFIFASGDIFGGGGQSILSVLYLIFLTNIIKINPVWAGAVIMISKVYDAVIDPLMGIISDNTRTSIGRRRPYLLLGGILIFFSIALLWFPIGFQSDTAKITYVTITYLFYCTAGSIISVPYSSLSTEVTLDFKERNGLNMLRLTVSLIATAVCTLVPTFLFENLTTGKLPLTLFYRILVFGFGLLFAIPIILIGLFVKERAPYNSAKATFSITTFSKPFKVKAFKKLLLLYISQSITLDIVSAVIMYYSLYVIKGLGSTVFLGTFLGIQLLLFPLINNNINKVSKTKIYRLGLPLTIVASIALAFYPTTFPIWGVYIVTGLMALGFAGAQTMSWIMFPDVVDISELGLKERITGSFSGLMAFVRTSSTAIAIFLIGLILGFTGFITPSDSNPIPVQPPAAILGIRLVICLAFVLIMSFAYITAQRFHLTPHVSNRVKYFLDKQHEGKISSLSANEKAEYDEILKEFV